MPAGFEFLGAFAFVISGIATLLHVEFTDHSRSRYRARVEQERVLAELRARRLEWWAKRRGSK